MLLNNFLFGFWRMKVKKTSLSILASLAFSTSTLSTRYCPGCNFFVTLQEFISKIEAQKVMAFMMNDPLSIF